MGKEANLEDYGLVVISKDGEILYGEEYMGYCSPLKLLLSFLLKRHQMKKVVSTQLVSNNSCIRICEITEDAIAIFCFPRSVPLGETRQISSKILRELRPVLSSFKVKEDIYINFASIPKEVMKYYNLSSKEKSAIYKNRQIFPEIIDRMVDIYEEKVKALGQEFPPERKENLRQGYLAFASLKINEELAKTLLEHALFSFRKFKLNPYLLDVLLRMSFIIFTDLLKEKIDPRSEEFLYILRGFKKGVFLTLGGSYASYIFTKIRLIEEKFGLPEKLIFRALSVPPPSVKVDESSLEELKKKFFFLLDMKEEDLRVLKEIDFERVKRHFEGITRNSEKLRQIYEHFKLTFDAFFDIILKGEVEESFKRIYEMSLYQELRYRMIYALLRLVLTLEGVVWKLYPQIYDSFFKYTSVLSALFGKGYMDRIDLTFSGIIELPGEVVREALKV